MEESTPTLPVWLHEAVPALNRGARRNRAVAWHVDDVRAQLRAVDDPPLHVGPEGSACSAFVSTRPERVDWFVRSLSMLTAALRLWLRRTLALRAFAALTLLVIAVISVLHRQRNDRVSLDEGRGPPGQLAASLPFAAHAPPSSSPQFDGLAGRLTDSTV